MQSTSAGHGATHTTGTATISRKREIPWVSGLQLHMTLSYIAVTAIAVLVLEGFNLAFLAIVSSAILPEQAGQVLMPIVREQAQVYALEAQVQASGPTLDPQSTFRPDQSGTLAPPDVGAPFAIAYTPSLGAHHASSSGPEPLALLITPSGRVLASSSPARFPLQAAVATLLPARSALIATALAGRAASASDLSAAATVLYVAEPVWSRDHMPIGAVYLQVPALPLHVALFQRLYPWSFLGSIFTVGLVLLLLPVVGGAFGTLTTRGLVQRVQVLAAATRQVTDGNYAQRVRVTRCDELGQLERHFNHMAAQLDDSLRQRQALAEQNARLAERARISREMHDAVSQDLFSLRMLADGLRPLVPQHGDIQCHLQTLEQTTERMTRGLRALLLELRPPELDHLGLADALESLAELYRTRLSIVVTTHIAPITLAHAVEHALLRIAQEALANAARHAGATAITLDLSPTANGDGVQLTIHDDGHGFDAADANVQFGLGLRLIRERVQEVNGTVEVTSVPSGGTTLTITVPSSPTGGAT